METCHDDRMSPEVPLRSQSLQLVGLSSIKVTPPPPTHTSFFTPDAGHFKRYSRCHFWSKLDSDAMH